jgi:hypothetical protein
MRRVTVVLGVLGLLGATALTTSAQQTKEVTLFGKKYTVTSEKRAGAYKNGKTVVVPDDLNIRANLHFSEGADSSQDWLLVTDAITSDDAVHGHQMYILEGTDANGCFTHAASNLIEFFGGDQNRQRGGRPINGIVLNRENTGVKADRNVLAVNFWNEPDSYRLFDLDTMNGVMGDNDDGVASDALFARAIKGKQTGEEDPNLPAGAFPAFAPIPNYDGHTVIIMGATEDNASGAAIGVWDTRKNEAFNVLTDLVEITKNSTNPLKLQSADGTNLQPHSMIRYSVASNTEAEYWFLYSPDVGQDQSTRTTNQLVRVKLTFPADLASAGPGSIKAEILGIEEIIGKTALYEGEGGVMGIAVGREANGGRRLYFADWGGSIYCLNPVP